MDTLRAIVILISDFFSWDLISVKETSMVIVIEHFFSDSGTVLVLVTFKQSGFIHFTLPDGGSIFT